MTSRLRLPAPVAVSVFAAAALLVGCASGNGAGPNAPRKDLPPYAGHSAELFDDAIEPRAVGLDLDQAPVPKADPILRERVQQADAVLVVLVTTITSKHQDSGPTFSLGMRTVQKLVGAQPPPDEFSVNVGKSSPSLGLVRSLDSRAVGKRFIIFVRDFASGEDDEVHFHVVVDSKEEVAAIRDAAVLAEIK